MHIYAYLVLLICAIFVHIYAYDIFAYTWIFCLHILSYLCLSCTYIAYFLFAYLCIFLHFWYCTLLHISCIYICIFKSAYYGIFTTISPWAYSSLESICLHIQCRFFYILKMHACAYLVLHICVYCCISMHSVFAYLSIFLLPRPISLINI